MTLVKMTIARLALTPTLMKKKTRLSQRVATTLTTLVVVTSAGHLQKAAVSRQTVTMKKEKTGTRWKRILSTQRMLSASPILKMPELSITRTKEAQGSNY